MAVLFNVLSSIGSICPFCLVFGEEKGNEGKREQERKQNCNLGNCVAVMGFAEWTMMRKHPGPSSLSLSLFSLSLSLHSLRFSSISLFSFSSFSLVHAHQERRGERREERRGERRRKYILYHANLN